jgi:hypothetical protein
MSPVFGIYHKSSEKVPSGARAMTRLTPIPLLLLAIAAPAAAQTGQPANAAAVRRSIDAGNAACIAAFKRADAKAVAQVYAPEGARLNEAAP